MKLWVYQEILKPVIRRLGTAAGAYLAGIGVAATTVEQIVLGGTALAAVTLELLLSNRDRR